MKTELHSRNQISSKSVSGDASPGDYLQSNHDGEDEGEHEACSNHLLLCRQFSPSSGALTILLYLTWVYSDRAQLANYSAPCGANWGHLIFHWHLGSSAGFRLVSLTSGSLMGMGARLGWARPLSLFKSSQGLSPAG